MMYDNSYDFSFYLFSIILKKDDSIIYTSKKMSFFPHRYSHGVKLLIVAMFYYEKAKKRLIY